MLHGFLQAWVETFYDIFFLFAAKIDEEFVFDTFKSTIGVAAGNDALRCLDLC